MPFVKTFDEDDAPAPDPRASAERHPPSRFTAWLADWFAPYKEVFGTLRFRLSIWNTAIVLLMVVMTMLGVREGVRLALLNETDQLMVEDSREMGIAVAESYPDIERIGHELSRKVDTHGHRKLYVKLLDSTGKVLWQGGTVPEPPLLPNTDNGAFLPRTVGTHRLMQHRIDRAGISPLTLRVGFSLEPLHADVAQLTRMMVAVGAVGLLIAPLGGYWLAGRATRPLARIIDTTARLHPTNLDERLHLRGTRDELDRLCQTINGFLDRIAAYLAQNREFTANAAHELRSPLAAIQSSLEVAMNTERSVEEYKELIGVTLEECGALRDLVNHLLLLSESDADRMDTGRELIRFDRIVEKSCDMFTGVADTLGIELTVAYIEPVNVRGDAGRLRQVINNLLDNAIKFSRSGGQIVVDLRIRGEDQKAVLKVSDTGVGIPAEDLPRIFERFYRGDKSRQRKSRTGGTGLGLSICEAIITAHLGQIELRSSQNRGTTVIVTLPVAAPEPGTPESAVQMQGQEVLPVER